MNGFKDKQFIEKKVGEINKIQDSGHKAQEKLLKILALPTINNKEYFLLNVLYLISCSLCL